MAAQQLLASGKPLAFPNGLFGNAPQLPPGDAQAQNPRPFAPPQMNGGAPVPPPAA
jgi:hypothetical protein